MEYGDVMKEILPIGIRKDEFGYYVKGRYSRHITLKAAKKQLKGMRHANNKRK
jgi:hypothetical protein